MRKATFAMVSAVSAISAIGALGGCASYPVRERPIVDMPAAWSLDAPDSAAIKPGTPETSAFWGAFGSSELAGLIASAEAQNVDVIAARARIAQADALARVDRAPLYPTLNAQVDVLGQSSNSRSLGSVNGAFVDLGLSAGYEVDLWGKNRARAASGRSTFEASRYDRASAALTVAAAVAESYFEILALRERVAIAKGNVATTQRVLNLVEVRARAGTALASEVAQQRALVASEQSAVERLARDESTSRVALAVILGRTPSSFDVHAESLEAVREPPTFATVPSDLLTRRPDVARIEAELAATRANVASARAALLPRLQLTASAALQSAFGSSSIDGSSVVYTGLASLSQPIFDGGTLAGQRDYAMAQRQEALARYRQTLLVAMADVERALRALAGVDREQATQRTVVEQATIAFKLVETEYRAGSQDLLVVLDAQRTLARAEDDLSQTRLARFRALVGLFKALGGGWKES